MPAYRLTAAIALIACLGPQNAVANTWARQPVTINGLERPVAEVLREVIGAGGFRADVPARLRGTVSGSLNQRPREAFLRLVDAYQLQWWRDGDVIHVTSMADMQTRSFDVSPLGGKQAMALLRQLGLLNNHLPLAGSGTILRVSGPGQYLAAVADALDNARRQRLQLHDQQTGQPVIRVFPLKHARASDMMYDNGEVRVTVPGVASLISDLLRGASAPVTLPVLPATVAMPVKPATAFSQAAEPAPQADPYPSEPGPQAARYPSDRSQPERVTESTGDGHAIAHGQTNAILVRAPVAMMPSIAEAIAQLDVPHSSVEIEATIIDVSSDAQKDLGVDWLAFGVRSSGGTLTLSDQDSGGFIARIRALEAEGKARVQSQPRIRTLNNTEAVISSVERMHVRVAGDRVAQLYEMDAGLRLRVMPSIGSSPEPDVRLAINLKDGTLNAANAVDGIPTIQDHSIATQAVIADGSSLLIGGYTLTRESTQSRRVPFLSRIPLIGALFRSRRVREERFQRIVMITPRLPVRPPPPIAFAPYGQRQLQ
ncbi:MAG TPA: secretin N-terminal domain-containing protein [Stenotrophomonas sp.]|nr:secretin N-terminal domain-containing protein [Stenotrophomonas sp.]